MFFEFEDFSNQRARIKVLGVGGGGGNAVDRMIKSGIEGVEFIAINTDAQDLEKNKAPVKIQIGRELTKGLGAGAVLDVGRNAIAEDKEKTIEVLQNTDMVFITAGMGGGTGTGAAPIVAEIAKSQGCLTIAIVTKPFLFEGIKRMRRAEQGIKELKKNVDTLIVIPNQQLLGIVSDNTPFVDAFQNADSVLYQATKGISDLINKHGVMNLDFADIKTIMKDMGDAIMGTGLAAGEDRATLAAQLAITSPLLNDMSICGAKGLLINITGGPNLNLKEVETACHIIAEEAGDESDTIIGTVIDPELDEEIMITVIATGFNSDTEQIKQYEKKKSEPIQIPESTLKPIQPITTTVKVKPVKETYEELEKKLIKKENPKPKQSAPKTQLEIPTFIRNRLAAQ